MRGSRRLPAQPPIQARMAGCTSVSMCQGSTEPRLRSASGLRVRGVARFHLTATFRMPFGLPNAVTAHQRLLRSILEAQEVRHCAVLAEMEMSLEDPPVPLEPPESPGPGGS